MDAERRTRGRAKGAEALPAASAAGPKSGARLSPDQSRTLARPANAPGPDEDQREASGLEEAPLGPPASENGRNGRPFVRGREREQEFLRLTELLRPDLVMLPLRAGDRWEAVDELIRLLVRGRELPAALAEDAGSAVREREAIRPTGRKYGLAFPNGRVACLKRILGAVGVSPEGVDFACRDGLPARIVVLILFPEACYARFAPAIEDVAETFEEAALREAVLGARSPAEVVDAIEEAESREVA